MRSIPGRDWRTMIMLLCMYGFIYAFYDVYGGTFFPLFMLSLSFFIMIRYIKRSLKENLYRLRNQLTIMRTVLRLHPEGSPVLRDFTALTRCKKTLPGLLLAHLIVSLFDMTRAVHGQPEWVVHLIYAIWIIVSVLFLYVSFRVRGPVVWNARTFDHVNASRARIEERQAQEMRGMEEGGTKMEGPVSKPEAFSMAIFMQVGILDEENGRGDEGVVVAGVAKAVSKSETELAESPQARVNGVTKTICLATSPWRVSPGTFVLDPAEIEERADKSAGMRSKEDVTSAAVAGMTKESDVAVEVVGGRLDECLEEEDGVDAKSEIRL